MAEWHGYILVTLAAGLPLTSTQKSKVRDTVRGMAVREDKRPQRMFQTRLSLDGTQAIYEAVWDRDRVTPAAVMNAVAGTLGVSPAVLAGNVAYRLFADGGSWEDSRAAVIDFLRENVKAWEPDNG